MAASPARALSPAGDPPARVPLLLIARSFALVSATAFGGGQMRAIRREVVKRRGWFSQEEFLEMMSIAQLLPGANPINVAVLVGGRLRGAIGAAVALASVVLPGSAILLLLAVIAVESRLPAVQGALRGCAAAAVGLTLANAIELTLPRRREIVDLAIIAAVVTAVIGLHVSLVVTLLVFVPLSFAATHLVKRRAA